MARKSFQEQECCKPVSGSSAQGKASLPRKLGHALCTFLKDCCLAFIWFYQTCISPCFGPHCRFRPTCSEYARQAIVKYGAAKGSWLAFKRIMRCHPYHKGGDDPVP